MMVEKINSYQELVIKPEMFWFLYNVLGLGV